MYDESGGLFKRKGAYLDDPKILRAALNAEAERIQGLLAERLPGSEVSELVGWHVWRWSEYRANFLKRQRWKGLVSGSMWRMPNAMRNAEIRARYEEGESKSAISRAVGVSHFTVIRALKAAESA